MTLNMKYGEQITEQFQRETLAALLDQCTEKQRELFARMYPTGPHKDQLAWAITQCNNTLVKCADPAPERQEARMTTQEREDVLARIDALIKKWSKWSDADQRANELDASIGGDGSLMHGTRLWCANELRALRDELARKEPKP